MTNEDLMQLEAQRRTKRGKRKKLLKNQRDPGDARGFSLSEEARFIFEAKDSNVEWYLKVTAAIQNVVQCYHVIYDKRKRATA